MIDSRNTNPRVKRHRKRSKRLQIALLIETSHEYGRGLIRGITRYNNLHGAWSIYLRLHGRYDPPPAWLKSWRGDGILARISTPEMAETVLSTGLPVIDLRGSLGHLDLPPFGPDSFLIAKMGVEHLTNCGFRNFAFMGEPNGIHRYDDMLCQCFEDLVAQAGFGCNTFKHSFKESKSVHWEREQKRIIAWVSSLPKPVGIFTVHDDRGQQVLEACVDAKVRVPDEVAVLSVDNDPYMCNLATPPLSSIDVNAEEVGFAAAEALNEMIHRNTTLHASRLFPPKKVIVRQSTDVLSIDDRQVAEALKFIRKYACDGITVNEVLKQIPLSRSMFHRRFKKALGKSAKSEITRIQMTRARELLIDSDLPIAKVSELCGFSESKYFIQVFRQLTGETPANYRQLHGTRQPSATRGARRNSQARRAK